MKQQNLFQNLKFSLTLLKQDTSDKSFYLYSGMHVVLGVIVPLLAAAFPGYVVGLMVGNHEQENPLLKLMCIITAILLLQIVDTYALRMYEQILFLFRDRQGSTLLKKALEIPYYLCESAEGQKQFEKARRAVYEGNENGIEMFLKQFPEMGVNILGIVAYAIIIGAANPLFVLMLAGFTVLALWASALTGKKDYVVQDKLSEEYTRLQYMYQTTLDTKGAKDIRMYRIKEWFLNEFEILREKALRLQKKSAGYYFFFDNLERILAFIRDGIVYGGLIYLMYRGEMSIDMFILNIGIVAGFNGWITGLFSNVKELTRNNTIVGHYREFLSYGEEKQEHPMPVPNPSHAHTLTMEHVSFTYPNAEQECIRDLSFTIRSGEKIALVGVNGAGKSTVIKLLLGLYQPTSGRILLDGEDISTMEKEQYFQEFSVVFQEVFAFAASIADNVAGCSVEKQDAVKVREKLDLAGLWEKVNSLPQKEKTNITKSLDPEGINLSGGEMQKLMLARTLYKDAPIVILDEPTAALDPIAEHELYQKYSDLTEGKTSVFISHRLSSTRFCDRIFFFESGQITEEGTHEELIKKKGEYAKMYEVQAHYYRKEEGLNEREV